MKYAAASASTSTSTTTDGSDYLLPWNWNATVVVYSDVAIDRIFPVAYMVVGLSFLALELLSYENNTEITDEASMASKKLIATTPYRTSFLRSLSTVAGNSTIYGGTLRSLREMIQIWTKLYDRAPDLHCPFDLSHFWSFSTFKPSLLICNVLTLLSPSLCVS
ncbi:hypothetical protein CsSME_00031177 [Camellia sinensis var. sinensis]